MLRVLAVFQGSIYSGYSGYFKASVSHVCTAGLLFSGLCILLNDMFPSLAVFGTSVLLMLAVLAALI